MYMDDVRKLIMEKERIDVIGKGVELFFFEIVQRITSMSSPISYNATFIISFTKGKIPYEIASLFRECEEDESSIITHLINEIAKMHGFEYIVPLSRDSVEYSQLSASLAYDFEAVFIRVDLKETKLPTSIFGSWQDKAIESIERHNEIIKAANRIEGVIIDKAYELIYCSSRSSKSNPNYYREVALDLNSYLPEDILKMFSSGNSSELYSILEERFRNNDSLIEFTVSAPSLQGQSTYSEKELVPSVSCKLTVYLNNLRSEGTGATISDIGKSDYKESKVSIERFLEDISSKFN